MKIAKGLLHPKRHTDYLCAEILVALINAVALLLSAIYILYEAWHPLRDPPEVLG